MNTATGNFLEPEVDLLGEGAAVSLAFTRMYNSLDSRAGAFGTGWWSVLDIGLTLTDEGANFVMADGRQIHFPRLGTGWDRAAGENYWLAAEDDADLAAFLRHDGQLLVVRNNADAWWAFNAAGRALGWSLRPGAGIRVTRGNDGRITGLFHQRGRSIAVEYLGDRVAYIASSDGRRVEYEYDSCGRLTGTRSEAGSRGYHWNEQGLIDQVVSAAGVVECENAYDDSGRVIEQVTPFGRRVRFAYLPGRVTSVSNHDGSKANTWIFDRKGRIVGIIDADGKRQSMAYDRHGNLVSVTQRDGQTTVHAYDDRGRRIRTVTPEGADITFGYDESDRLTTVVTASGGVTECAYASSSDRNPSTMIDPVGGRTEIGWRDGLLTSIADPEGVALRFGYDGFGDLVSITNMAGDTARFVHDPAGRIIQAVSPSGNTTKYRYDAAGLLTSRQDADGAIWAFEHGAGGKITATIDPLGARTEFEYGPHGELVATRDPLGRVIRRQFDEDGNLSSVTLPDGAGWEFVHDGLARLLEIIDPAGGAWSREYDSTGQLTRTVDPTGVVTGITHDRCDGVASLRTAFDEVTVQTDEYGRPVKRERADGSTEVCTYDACGRVVEILDADGGLTRIGRDQAGRVIAFTSPAGRLTRYEYDACGRPVAAIDPLGGRSTLSYDPDSRVVARTSPTGEVTQIDYDPMGRVLRERIPGFGTRRYRYDKAGRVVGVHDAWLGERRFSYDAAGQLIAARNSLGGVTRYEYDSRGRMIRVIDPVGGVTTRSYTELDKVASSTDQLGRTTYASYDAAGRQLSQTDPDGDTLEWCYDAAGLAIGMSANGRPLTAIERDSRTRTAMITDYTAPGGKAAHALRFDRCGRLIERVTHTAEGVRTSSWVYDPDGVRTSMVAPDGTRISYEHDAVGCTTRIVHSVFGEIGLGYDASGRLCESRAGDILQAWKYADGQVVEHCRTTSEGGTSTSIIRDEDGRIIRIDGPGGPVTYTHDQAGQLVKAAGQNHITTWAYDTSGRMARETGPQGERQYSYDEAGQLLSVSGSDGERTEYAYDGQGRRIRKTHGEGVTDYRWDSRGWLSKVSQHDSEESRDTDLWVDALGELAHLDGKTLSWDTAAITPSLISIGGTSVFHGPGGLNGIDGQWRQPAWRQARATADEDPWQTLAGVSGSSTAGASLGTDGSVNIAGLEWMGSRVFDPASHGFLSVDPLAPVTGAAWASNPYSYAGNDPLHAVDPLGLRPVTDEELGAYADGLQGPLAQAWNAAGDWISENRDYLIGGAMVVAGGVLMATGVGGPAGMMLMAAGADTIVQKVTTGEVNWGEVVISGVLGGFTGIGVAGKLGLTGLKATVAAGVVSGSASGSATGAYHYATGPGPHTVQGFIGATTTSGLL
ncbi:DUF6531 domain-containing protein, partial [Brooklawnia sp.]|uniref:DUF6531 domain-containing protein n=1 Tax=Brooklawnia sp. TaxID=2699740 RepID=UPI00311EE6CC